MKQPKGIRVTLRENEHIDKALRKFKNKVKDNGNLRLLQEREFYLKPSLERKKAKAIARSRYLKKIEKENTIPKISLKKPKNNEFIN